MDVCQIDHRCLLCFANDKSFIAEVRTLESIIANSSTSCPIENEVEKKAKKERMLNSPLKPRGDCFQYSEMGKARRGPPNKLIGASHAPLCVTRSA